MQNYQATSIFTSDRPGEEDLLWDEVYARALADFLTSDDTQPPLTIGIDAPWGGGKTSLMKALRRRLDPDFDKPPKRARRMTVGRLQKHLESASEGEAPQVAPSSRPFTVWFNAWKFSRDEQLWAALVRTVIQQVTEQMDPVEREDFLLRLNLRRVDREKIRKKIRRMFFNQLLPFLVLQILMFLVAAFELFETRMSSTTMWSLNAVPAFGLVYKWWQAKRKPLSIDLDLEQYVKEPRYEEKVGFQAEVEEDFRHVQEALGRERRLVIFVDDLDRCAPAKISELIEAINVFFDFEESRCFFVLGLDKDYLQAGLESAYGSWRSALGADGGDFGEQFLAKIVQVWLRVPEPKDEAMRLYLEAILDTRKAVPRVKKSRFQETREERRARRTGLERLEAVAEDVAEEQPEIASEVVAGAKREEAVRRFTEKDPEVREMLAAGARELEQSPRQVKLFLNQFRLEALVRVRRGEALEGERLRELALEVARESRR